MPAKSATTKKRPQQRSYVLVRTYAPDPERVLQALALVLGISLPSAPIVPQIAPQVARQGAA